MVDQVGVDVLGGICICVPGGAVVVVVVVVHVVRVVVLLQDGVVVVVVEGLALDTGVSN